MTQEKRKTIEKKGVVTSDKIDKTRVVVVEKLTRHPLYLKVIKQRRKFYAHDESNMSKKGDVVIIRQTRPLSKLKRWEIVEIIRKENPKVKEQ
ncbi:MAG: 30S ribosomal protein S17 [Candidatus Omnitrophica bacterium]|nr:30S ribosomal protein S17 [Candidatus Omnitrophota bacterium]MCM8824874.1 30S ribosomal protein S17 [Candidatus Omnitrophota bacterium]